MEDRMPSVSEMGEIKFKLAKPGIFKTFQGEGALLGLPMVFIRLAGCSVGCKKCDTNYEYDSEKTINEIIQECCKLMDKVGDEAEWIWITGGEPTDQPNLAQLVSCLKMLGKVAVATSGVREIDFKPDFLSVSPHFPPSELKIKEADQINLVFGLNRCMPAMWRGFDFSGFKHKYTTPISIDSGDKKVLDQFSISWVKSYPEWRLGIQAHKSWGVD